MGLNGNIVRNLRLLDMVAVGSNLSAIIVGFKNFMQQESLCSSTEYLEIMYLEPEFNTINWGDTTDFDRDTLSTRIRIFSKMGIFFSIFKKNRRLHESYLNRFSVKHCQQQFCSVHSSRRSYLLLVASERVHLRKKHVLIGYKLTFGLTVCFNGCQTSNLWRQNTSYLAPY